MNSRFPPKCPKLSFEEMISHISITNFKSLKQVDLKLGNLNLFIGANASGKSNFFDALRVIQGIGYGLTFREILDGKPKSAANIEWDQIRGGTVYARFLNGGIAEGEAIKFTLHFTGISPYPLVYTIAFNPISGRLVNEELSTIMRTIFDTNVAGNSPNNPEFYARYDRPRSPGKKPHLKFDSNRPILLQFAMAAKVSEEDRKLGQDLIAAIGNMQRLDPQPEILRGYSQAQQIQRMGERGENFAALVRTICESAPEKEAFLAWLRELRPTEVDDVVTLSGALGEPLFALREAGKEFPAPVLSDGTLRFAAICAAFFQPDMPGVLTIEEIEKGIHASRLRLLLELLKSQAKRGRVQVMATTHSRSVLDWLDAEDYKTTFFCQRNPETKESRIVSLNEVPHLREAAGKEPLGDLFAENWLEAAL